MPVRPDLIPLLDPSRFMSRGPASEILQAIADRGSGGNYPKDIPPYLAGRAIARLVSNYCTSDEDIWGDFMEGLDGKPRTRVEF